jgi:hypothetical protein
VTALLLAAAALAVSRRAQAAEPAPPDSAAFAPGDAVPRLEGRIVRRIDLVTHTIFEPLPARGSPLYALANRVHIRTRAATVRANLTVKPGDRWNEERRAESERHLRSLAYLVPDTVSAIPVGDDSLDVRVVTHDNWTTSPEFGLESGGGQRVGSFAFTERNLLGLGTSLSLAYRSDVTGISRYVQLEDAELFGTHWRGLAQVGNGSAGRTGTAMLALPFWEDEAPVTLGASVQREVFDTDLFADGQVAANVRGRRDRADLFWGNGRLAPDGMIQRIVLSFEIRDRMVDPPTARAGAPVIVDGMAETLRIRRLAGELRLWRPHYLVRRGVDLMDREEDFDDGISLTLKTGFSPRAFGGTADEGYARVRADAGLDVRHGGFGTVHAAVQTRVRSGFRETMGEAGARWVQQPFRRLTAVAAAFGAAATDMPADFQYQLGGLNGLRGFPVHELAGQELWRANAEVRWIGVRDWIQLASVGAAAFWDTGRTWGPGADTEGWRQDVGFGLRVSLPHSALNSVARFDVAWPLTPGPSERRGPAYSFGSGQAF